MSNKFLASPISSGKKLLVSGGKYLMFGVYNISTSLQNVTGSPSNPTFISPAATATLTFTANEGFILPDYIVVMGSSYTWDKNTGTLVLRNPTSDVRIEIIGFEPTDSIVLDSFVLPSEITELHVIKRMIPQSLSITADDVSGRSTTTTIHWTSIYDLGSGKSLTLTGNDTSSQFPQNTSRTVPVQRIITYTKDGLTATTTITQGVWTDQSYTITNSGISDYGFEPDTTSGLTIDPSVYDGPYQSNNYHIDSSYSVSRIDFTGYNEFTIWINSHAESSWDYTICSELDSGSYPTSYSDGYTGNGYQATYSSSSGKYSNTYNYQKNPGNALDENNWRKITYTTDGGSHHIFITYKKDSSGYSNKDRGYFVVER